LDVKFEYFIDSSGYYSGKLTFANEDDYTLFKLRWSNESN
jgi:hypothetical protein